MASKASVKSAVQTALYNDNHLFDLNQVMSSAPYSYNTPDIIRDFLLDVAHELATDDPPDILNVDSLDLPTCMSSNVQQLIVYIFNEMLD